MSRQRCSTPFRVARAGATGFAQIFMPAGIRCSSCCDFHRRGTIKSPRCPPPTTALGTFRPAGPNESGMILTALFFYLFAGICLASAFMVIAAKNPVHSVLYLILAFVNAAGLFVLLGAEFLAMILIVVYVGAVAVLT